MKKLVAVLFALAVLLSLSVSAFAVAPLVEIEGDVIRLRDDGAGDSYTSATEDVEVVLNATGVGNYTLKQGPVTITFDRVFVCSLTVHDAKRAAGVYGGEADTPLTLIRLMYTVENTGSKSVLFPGKDAWAVTSMGELAQGHVQRRNADETVPEKLEPGEKLTRYLFFSCPETFPEAISFFTVVFPAPHAADGSTWSIPRAVCVELRETAM